jgi:hypothetical protein
VIVSPFPEEERELSESENINRERMRNIDRKKDSVVLENVCRECCIWCKNMGGKWNFPSALSFPFVSNWRRTACVAYARWGGGEGPERLGGSTGKIRGNGHESNLGQRRIVDGRERQEDKKQRVTIGRGTRKGGRRQEEEYEGGDTEGGDRRRYRREETGCVKGGDKKETGGDAERGDRSRCRRGDVEVGERWRCKR